MSNPLKCANNNLFNFFPPFLHRPCNWNKVMQRTKSQDILQSASYRAWDKGGWITEVANYLHRLFLRHRKQQEHVIYCK